MSRHLFVHLILITLFINAISAQKNLAFKVDPMIGTGAHGHTFPGPSAPFGMIQAGPDTRLSGWDGCSGFHHTDSVVYGFSQTHLSGTGCSDYGDVLIMPTRGEIIWDKHKNASEFRHDQEHAHAGYYSVHLEKPNTDVEITTLARTAMYKFIYQEGDRKNLMIDLTHRDKVLDSYLKIVDDHTLVGLRRSSEWARDQFVYFAIRFSKPWDQIILAKNDLPQDQKSKMIQGEHVKGALSFQLGKSTPLYVAISISAVDEEGALKNLNAEMPEFNFEKYRRDAESAWNKELSKISVMGGNEAQQKIFYTALYHSLLTPSIYQDVDGRFRGMDLKIHESEGFDNYTLFSLWDTYRSFHPLMAIIQRKKTLDWIKTFLAQYKYGGMLPVWELSANETHTMIGYHSVSVIADAYTKGIKDFDTEYALKAMIDYAEKGKEYMKSYEDLGYLSGLVASESVSKTLEYSYDDWCIAQFAKAIGKIDVYERFLKRSQSYKNIYDPKTGFMRGKDDGLWSQPFSPREVNSYFTEANSWQYSFAVPHDIKGLAALHGGNDTLISHIDRLFAETTKTEGWEQSDITGMMGQYAHGNEPSHHIAYLYNLLGAPWKTEERVSKIMKDFYTDQPDGLIGNEDSGQMSAWYVLSALGLYSICPGDPDYVFGTPSFKQANITLENGKNFQILANGLDDKNIYVQSVYLNGKRFERSAISYQDILNGGDLVFNMGAEPAIKTPAYTQFPVTSVEGASIVISPSLLAPSEIFQDSMTIGMENMDKNAKNFYKINDGSFVEYSHPFTIHKTSTIEFYGEKDQTKSSVQSYTFNALPERIKVLEMSPYLKTKDGGGKNAIIDGRMGKLNFRLGNYYLRFQKNDFETVIDLGEQRQVNELTLNTLQDLGAWIVVPKEVIYYVSDDGVNFKLHQTVKHQLKDNDYKVQFQPVTSDKSFKARYIKVVAKQFGPLPSWHYGAGGDSIIFIDELIIK